MAHWRPAAPGIMELVAPDRARQDRGGWAPASHQTPPNALFEMPLLTVCEPGADPTRPAFARAQLHWAGAYSIFAPRVTPVADEAVRIDRPGPGHGHQLGLRQQRQGEACGLAQILIYATAHQPALFIIELTFHICTAFRSACYISA